MCPFIHLEFTRFPIPAHSPWDAKPLLAAKIVEVRDTSLASKLGLGISNMEFWNRTHGALHDSNRNTELLETLSSTSLFNSSCSSPKHFLCMSFSSKSIGDSEKTKSTIIVEWSLTISMAKSSKQTKQSKTPVKSFLTYINWVLGLKTLFTGAPTRWCWWSMVEKWNCKWTIHLPMTQFTLSHFDKVVTGNNHLKLCYLFHPGVVSEVTLLSLKVRQDVGQGARRSGSSEEVNV